MNPGTRFSLDDRVDCAAIVAFYFFIYGLVFFALGYLDDSQQMASLGLIPYDSILYVKQAEELRFSELSLFDVILGGLNWLTLSFLYGLFKNLGSGSIAFLVINSLSLYLCLCSSAALFPDMRHKRLFPFLVILLSPYLIGWILAPNKEILSCACVSIVMLALKRDNMKIAFVASLVFGLVKVQMFFGFAFFVVVYRFKNRKTTALFILSVLLPLALKLHPGLSMATFLENQVDEINSASFFSFLDEINEFVFGFVVVAPIRLVANLFSGGYAYRLFEYGEIGDLIAPATSLILAIISLMCAIKLFSKKYISIFLASDSNCLLYLYCLILVHLLVPFLQPRYFWWAMPIMLAFLLDENKPKFENLVGVQNSPAAY